MSVSAKPQSSLASNKNSITEYTIAVIASGILALSFFSRIKNADLPLTRDEGSYGYLGKAAMMGKIPYLELFEMKPPMLFYFYGLGGKIFGTNDLGLRYLALFLTVLSCFLLFKLIRNYTSFSTAIFSAAAYAFFSLNLFCFGFSMVAEHFINPILLGTSLIVTNKHSKKSMIIFAGFLFGLAVLTKQTVALFLPLFVFAVWIKTENEKFKKLMLFLLGGSLSLLLFIFFLFGTNALNEAKFWLIEYPSAYTESITTERGKQYFEYFLKNIFGFSPLLFLIAIAGILISFVNFKHSHAKLFIIYLITAVCTIIPGFRFYGQYWLLILIPISIGLAYLIENLKRINVYFGAIISVLTGLLFLMEFNFKKQYYFANKVPKQMEKLYEGNPFEAIKNISQYASKIMGPNDRLMVLGSEPQIYLYTNKVAPSDHIYLGFLSRNIEQNIAFRKKVMNDLESKNPEYIINNLFPFSWIIREGSSDELYRNTFYFCRNNYNPIMAYNLDNKSYLYKEKGEQIDVYKPNQIVLFKRKQ